MSHSNASKLLLLLTSSLICLGCDDEPQTQPQTPAPVTQSASTQDAPARQSSPAAKPTTAVGAATEAAPATEADLAEEAPGRGAPRQTSATNSSSAATPEASLETRGHAAGINQALRGDAVQSPLSIESSLEAAQGQWIARWTVRNESQEPVYLVTQLPTVKAGKVRPDQHRIYVRPQGETLHVTKRMWRIPRAVSPLHPELPFLIRLEPGQVHQGAIRLPASIAANYPYRSGAPTKARALVNQVVLSFGYFSQDAGPQPSAEAPGLFTLPYGALSQQTFVSSTPHPARLLVR